TATPGQTPLGPPQTRLEDNFARVWAHTDWPLAAGYTTRSWVWGPAAFDTVAEPYQQGANGRRMVQYWDKARMEINDPAADPTTPWYVTNGLLVVEMVDGRLQLGDNQYEARAPAQEPVVGDPSAVNPDAPSYAALRGIASLNGDHQAASAPGTTITAYLDRRGVAGSNAKLGDYGVRVGQYVAETHHNVADRFWTYLQQQGLMYDGGSLANGPLLNWVYVTGYPISEPYWVTAGIGGKPYAVLVQLFQRRVLTYIPDFAPEWQVQMGNVGQHYHAWRYDQP
ncbi:MAG TPA: hypothetical protein VM536_14035, partial [Chloroflexia bacterium]|nr:hypothetical protein [Chloroflexia bacterium]